MKITDPEIIKTGEKDLIDAVREDLDWEALKDILKEKISTAALESKDGQIIVHNNQVAFKINFDLKLSGSLMFDREGNYIPEDQDLKNAPATDPGTQNGNMTGNGEAGGEDLSDDDMNDILKESRDFWDQKEDTP